jgi:hypothetical protein
VGNLVRTEALLETNTDGKITTTKYVCIKCDIVNWTQDTQNMMLRICINSQMNMWVTINTMLTAHLCGLWISLSTCPFQRNNFIQLVICHETGYECLASGGHFTLV